MFYKRCLFNISSFSEAYEAFDTHKLKMSLQKRVWILTDILMWKAGVINCSFVTRAMPTDSQLTIIFGQWRKQWRPVGNSSLGSGGNFSGRYATCGGSRCLSMNPMVTSSVPAVPHRCTRLPYLCCKQGGTRTAIWSENAATAQGRGLPS